MKSDELKVLKEEIEDTIRVAAEDDLERINRLAEEQDDPTVEAEILHELAVGRAEVAAISAKVFFDEKRAIKEPSFCVEKTPPKHPCKCNKTL